MGNTESASTKTSENSKIIYLQQQFDNFCEAHCIFEDTAWISIQSFSAAFGSYLRSINYYNGLYMQDADYYLYSDVAKINFLNKGMEMSVGWLSPRTKISFNDTRVISGVTLKSFPRQP